MQLWPLLLTFLASVEFSAGLILVSPEDSYIPGVEGFGVDIRCGVNTCLSRTDQIKWYRGQYLIAAGKTVHAKDEGNKVEIKHDLSFDHNKDCTRDPCAWGENFTCPNDFQCLQNFCCPCGGEDYVLVLKNLTGADSGLYSCELDDGSEDPQSLHFELEVHDSGLKPGFTQNITFDHTECCDAQGISPKCRGLCAPGALETHSFDPMDCNTEIGKFLHCVTEGGNTSHVHCCKQQIVPPFCWKMCNGRLTSIRELPPICLYWLPEILECYEIDFLPIPKPPVGLMANAESSNSIKACWEAPENEGSEQLTYTVNYRKVPQLPFFGSNGFHSLLSPSGDRRAPPTVLLEEEALKEDDEHTSSGGGRREPREIDWSSVHGMGNEEVQRFKRQTWIFVSSNSAGNQSNRNQLKPITINTTDTCATLTELEPATQYFIDVTAKNEHGTSLPSVRSVAATQPVLYENATETFNKIKQCCHANGVKPECAAKLCDLNTSPSAFVAVDVVLRCQTEFGSVAPCLADGRDHSKCCRKKAVGGRCARLCNGTATFMGLESLLCLTLDMNSIFSCLREGYVTHPSPPRNVTVTRVGTSTALVSFAPPKENGNKVLTYSLFYRKDDVINEGWREISNATSPYELVDLEPESFYILYVVAHTEHGTSLRSTLEQFLTAEIEAVGVRGFGEPLRDPDGRRVRCWGQHNCPPEYECIAFDSVSTTFCCPKNRGFLTTLSPEEASLRSLKQCCKDRGVSQSCDHLCGFNTTADDLITYGPACIRHIKHWVDCGTDGRDHTPCCVAADVPRQCLDFCKPLVGRIGTEHLECIASTDKISTCIYEGVKKLPGPPKRLRVESLVKNKVELAWDPPHQRPQVDRYLVKLIKGGISVVQEVSLPNED